MADNYLYLSGVIGTESPTLADSAALDITGDLDLRAEVALKNWVPGSPGTYFMSKRNTTHAYSFGMNAANQLQANWYTATVASFVSSTALPTVAQGGRLQVRYTLDVDNGASGHDVTFYTRAPGTALTIDTGWTQLGDVVTTAGVTSIDSTDDPFTIGDYRPIGGVPVTGRVYYIMVKDGINGTVALYVDFTKLTADELAAASFTERSANQATVTLNGDEWAYVRPLPDSLPLLGEAELLYQAADGNKGGSAKWADRSGNEHHAQNGSAPGADTNDATFKGFETADGKYAYKPGLGNIITTPSLNLLDADMAHMYQGLGLWGSGPSTGIPTLGQPSTPTDFGGGIINAVDVEIDADTASIISDVNVGTITGLSQASFAVDIWVDDEEDIQSRVYIGGTTGSYSTLTPNAWNRISATTPGAPANSSVYLYFYRAGSAIPVATTFYFAKACLTEDADATFVPSLNLVGSLDVRIKCAADDWSSGGTQLLVDRYNASYGYRVDVTSIGGIAWTFANAAGDGAQFGSSNAFTLVDGEATEIRCTFNHLTGGVDYLQDGVSVQTATRVAEGVFESEVAMYVGVTDSNSAHFEGDIYYAEVRDGIDGPVVARFDADDWSEPYETHVDEASGQVWTATRPAAGAAIAFIDQDMWLFSVDNYMEAPDSPGLDFAADESFTVMARVRFGSGGAGSDYIISKKVDTTTGAGYHLLNDALHAVYFKIADGTFNPSISVASVEDNISTVLSGVRSVTSDELEAFVDGVGAGGATDTTTATLESAQVFRVGANSHVVNQHFEGEIMDIAVWRRELTPAEIIQAGAEMVTLPHSELGRHHDSLLAYLKDNYEIASGEVVSALNEFNGITTVGRKEYKGARDTAFGL